MSKTLGLLIGTRRYDVKEIDDDFALYLESQMGKDFNIDSNNDIATLLQAYVRKNYEIYKQNKLIKKLNDKLNDCIVD